MINEIESEKNEIFNLLMIYIQKLKERGWQIPKNKELQKAMEDYEENTDFLKAWLLKNFKVSKECKNPLSMNYIYEKFYKDYVDEFRKEPRYKKNTITKRIREIFKDEGQRVNMKNTDGTSSKDRVFKLEERIMFTEPYE